ncbi:MAG TPA: cupin domain-containing protein [Clostridiales bacterium]|jgi:mannose-6-phosphate isomerase-like protein (cupin superfamily)|nr:cupin domain-containing protein [Clostridiales bacterium]
MQQMYPYGRANPRRQDHMYMLSDQGGKPYVVNLARVVRQNNTFRTALWTGDHLQLTIMSIKPGDDIGLEIHPDDDQMIGVEDGTAIVQMGPHKDKLTFRAEVSSGYAIFVPAGTWHNIINTGRRPLKVFSVYAPPHHPFGTIHETKADAEADEHKY